MIASREDLETYLEADRVALGRKGRSPRSSDDIWRFQRTLRRLEYLVNCKKGRLRTAWVRRQHHRQGRRLGFTIPPNTFGPGLSIAHAGTIVVNGHARIGANCRLHVCVNIGTRAGTRGEAPTIGDNCYIGPGAKVFGPIVLGPNVAIGANAVVHRSFPEGNVSLGGVPARVISAKTSAGLHVAADA